MILDFLYYIGGLTNLKSILSHENVDIHKEVGEVFMNKKCHRTKSFLSVTIP